MTSTEYHDVVVLGAGPAGSIASLLLARAGAGTLLVDEVKDQAFRIGESLPGIARHLLGSLKLGDIWPRVASISSTGNSSAWGNARLANRPAMLNPYGAGVHLDRRAFDLSLLLAARQAGVRLMPARFCHSRAAVGRWVIMLQAAGRHHQIECRWVIDCSGRRAAFARTVGVKRLVFDRNIAVAGLFKRGKEDADRSIFLEAAPDGWWYSAPVPDEKRVVIYFTDGGLLNTTKVRVLAGFRSTAGQTSHMRQFVVRQSLMPEPSILSASTSRLTEPGGERWIAAGDAAASLDPLASAGIVSAIETSQAAVQVVLANGTGMDVYCKDLIGRHEAAIEKASAYYRMEQRWPLSEFWCSRHHGGLQPVARQQ